jgi:MFS family permease
MAIHVNFYTNACGVNTNLLLANSVMDKIVPSLALYVNLIVNSTRIPLGIYASLSLVKKIGRRPLFLVSSFLLTACNLGIAFGYLGNALVAVLVLIFLYMIVYGLLYNPVMITYPAEIIPQEKVIVGNIFNQAAMMICLFVPPIIINEEGGNGFGVFMVYGVYSALSFVYMFFYLKESKDLKYEEIVKSF